jgi:hypothetical protein
LAATQLSGDIALLTCRHCGDALDPERVELGYDYCTKDECQARYMKRVEMARVAVNKAADQFVKADEVRPPSSRVSISSSADEDEDDASVTTEPPTPEPRKPRRSVETKRRETPLERLRRAEMRLDAALAQSYERFTRGEITAREMQIERNKLVRAFNGLVRAENIRYWSMLRPELPD